MGLDLGADVDNLVAAFVDRALVVGVLGTLAVLLVAGWRPGGALPRRALLAPLTVAVIVSNGQIRVGALAPATLVVLVLVVAAIAIASPQTTALRELPLAGPLLLITALGLFACLPNTSGAITLAGGATLVVVLAPRAHASALTLALLPICVALVVASDGIRAGQIVGGIACLGMLAVLPLVTRLPGVDRHLRVRLETSLGWGVAVLTQLLVVVAVARGPGIRTMVEPGGYALPAALTALGLMVLANLPASGPHVGAGRDRPAEPVDGQGEA